MIARRNAAEESHHCAERRVEGPLSFSACAGPKEVVVYGAVADPADLRVHGLSPLLRPSGRRMRNTLRAG